MLNFDERLREISRLDIPRYQLEKMRELVQFHYENNPVYRRKCNELGIKPERIDSLDSIRHFPIIERDYLSKHSFFDKDPEMRGGSIPITEVATYLNSCGSTGAPKRVPISRASMQSIWEVSALALWIAGVKGFQKPGGGPILPITLHGPSAGCFFLQTGSELIGLAPKANMGLPFEWHYANLVDLDVRYVITTPSYISALANYIAEHGDFGRVKLDVIVLGGEYFGESFRAQIESTFGAKVRDLYGCSETQIVGVDSDRLHDAHPGYLHHLAHMSYIEVVRPGTDQLVAPGEEGEMLISVFNRRAWPVVRYRMGDIVQLPLAGEMHSEHGLPVMSRIRGRVDDRLAYGKAVVDPPTVFNAIDKFNRRRGEAPLVSGDKFQFVIENGSGGDPVSTLRIERVRPIEDRALAERELLDCVLDECKELGREVRERASVAAPRVSILEPKALYVNEQKLRRFVDARPGAAS